MSGVLCTWQGLQSGAVFFLSAAHPLGNMPVCRVFNYLSCQEHAYCQNVGLQQIPGDLYRWPRSPHTFSLSTGLIISIIHPKWGEFWVCARQRQITQQRASYGRGRVAFFGFGYFGFCLPAN